MYDILQLNDMLVPELLDIAEDLKIDNAKKLDKQGLIYKILDKQAVMSSEQKNDPSERPKRKRIVKASTANSTEEAIVEEPVADNKRPAKKAAPAKKDDKSKKVHKRKSDEQPETEQVNLQEEEEEVEDVQPEINNNEQEDTRSVETVQQPEKG